MSINYDSPTWRKYYQVDPEQKPLTVCYQHGLEHKVYGWSPKIDPRWSDEQKQAYIDGYEQKQKSWSR